MHFLPSLCPLFTPFSTPCGDTSTIAAGASVVDRLCYRNHLVRHCFRNEMKSWRKGSSSSATSPRWRPLRASSVHRFTLCPFAEHHPGTFSALNAAGFFSGALRTLKVSARSAQVRGSRHSPCFACLQCAIRVLSVH